MAKKTTTKKKTSAPNTKMLGTVRIPSPAKGTSEVDLLLTPPMIQKPKRIHPRHLLPLIKEGAERNVHSTTQELRMEPRSNEPLAVGDEVRLLTNTELEQPGLNRTASNVGEPSCAINGNTVLYTGNWYAAISSDAGASFRFMNPATAFPDPSPQSNFCCDQVVQYIPDLDTFVWLLQYGPSTGDNIQRLALAKSADAEQGRWKLFDISTQMLNVPGAFLDFPDLAVGANHLYVTTNIFGPGVKVGSAVARISFASIRSGNVAAQSFVSFDLQSFRVVQNCGTTAFFAAHADTSTLAVFSWPEDQAQPSRTDVGVARWIGGNGYNSRTPDGRRWLDRADPRISGATMVKKELWFAWSVDRRSNRRAQPFVQIARINSVNMTLLENINVFDPQSATAYANLSTNASNEVGISYIIGGGPRHPSHMVGVLTGTRKDLLVSAGERSPEQDEGKGEWGDYLAVRRVFPNQKLFAASGFTMKGQGDGSNRDVTPRFVVFGRARDVVGGPPPPPPPPPPGGDDLTKPFQDVNALPTVSPQVAAAIKAACVAEGQRDAPLDLIVGLKMVTKPGVERWPVKTAGDRDLALVGKNVIDGQKLGTGIVEATIEELIQIPRPADMMPVDKLFPKYQDRRRGPVEFTVWRIECDIIGVKLEKDGDYHLVLQGASGRMMIGETATANPPFVNADCPWIENMKDARKTVDSKLIARLSPQDFVQMGDILVPRAAVGDGPFQTRAMEKLPKSFVPPESPQEAFGLEMPTFQAQVPPTKARITGVGFFDKVHGQTGVSLLNGIELHPILKIEWL